MDWKTGLANLKTTISGAIGFLLSVPIFISALEDYGAHRPVNWVQVGIGVGMWAFSHGLLNAKDATTHSTIAEVKNATAVQNASATSSRGVN